MTWLMANQLQVFLFIALEKADVSSANTLHNKDTPSGKSFIYIYIYIYIYQKQQWSQNRSFWNTAEMSFHEDVYPLIDVDILNHSWVTLASYHLYSMFAVSRLNRRARVNQKFSNCLKMFPIHQRVDCNQNFCKCPR